MSQIFGSSRIQKVQITGICGNVAVGPTGPTGPTGNTGDYVTGPTGPLGKRITGIQGLSSDAIRIFLSPGPNIDLTGVAGNTGSNTIDVSGFFSVGFTGATSNAVYPVFMGDGKTLIFKPIQLIGELTGSYVGNDFVIKGLTSASGYQGSLIAGSLLYLGATLSGNQFVNIISAENQKYNESSYSGTTYSYFESLIYGFYESGVSNSNYFESENQTYSISSNINASFYGNYFSTDDRGDEISYVTPYLKFNISYPSLENGSTFSQEIAFQSKQNYTIPYVPASGQGDQIGSCCYCDSYGDRYCKDYVSEAYCSNTMGGSWSAIPCYLRYSTEDCFVGGACCVNNRCRISTRAKCLAMGGLFVPGENCSSVGECPSVCADPGCCCVEGTGYQLTRELCDVIPNSRFFDNPCSEVDCCKVGYLGACCIRKECFDNYSALECAATGGVYQGVGSACASQFINCCTDPMRSTT
jgi:hypothetical protein